jgi:hypothetical protein
MPGPARAVETVNLRRIVLHMIEETARHLDTACELLDGPTGWGVRTDTEKS